MTVCLDLNRLPPEPDTLARLRRCACGQPVLIARVSGGGTVALDPAPVLIGDKQCGHCFGKSRREGSRSCPACGNTGRRGVPLDSSVHKVMAITGLVRERVCMIEPWDSAYRRHECAHG